MVARDMMQFFREELSRRDAAAKFSLNRRRPGRRATEKNQFLENKDKKTITMAGAADLLDTASTKDFS